VRERSLEPRGLFLLLGMAFVCVGGWICPAFAEKGEVLEEFALDGIRVDLQDQVLRLEASVCLREGILEYVAVSRGGKTYESLFELKAKPSQIHAGLLLVGVEPISLGDNSKRTETQLRIQVEWENEEGSSDKVKPIPIEEFLTDRTTEKRAEMLTWFFSGSILGPDIDSPDGKGAIYVADMEKSVIAIWPDQTAVLNPVQKSGNPYRGNTYGFEAKTDSLPKLGAKAWLVIQRIQP